MQCLSELSWVNLAHQLLNGGEVCIKCYTRNAPCFLSLFLIICINFLAQDMQSAPLALTSSRWAERFELTPRLCLREENGCHMSQIY